LRRSGKKRKGLKEKCGEAVGGEGGEQTERKMKLKEKEKDE